MKSLIKIFIPAVLGGIVSIGGYTALQKEINPPTLQDSQAQTIDYQAKLTNYDKTTSGTFDIDFSTAAAIATPSVVHIKATVSSSAQQQTGELPDMFKHFFEQDGFRGQMPKNNQPQPRVGAGSGVIISEDGYIVTNNHVIDNAEKIEITLNDNKSFEAEVIGTDPTTDLALLKVNASDLPAMKVGNSDGTRVGQWVLAVGNPFNLESTVTSGIISAKGRSINILKENAAVESFIQTDAAINPGNSGGALVNLKGELIGINTAIASPTGAYSGYGFAVPSNLMSKVLKDLKEYGGVQRGFLGVSIRELNSDLAKEMEVDIVEGVVVQEISEDGAARKAGIQKADIIIEVDDKPINTVAGLQETIARQRPGDIVSLTVIRAGKEKIVAVPLKNKYGNTEIVKNKQTKKLQSLGVELEVLPTAEQKELGIDGGVKVARLYPGKLRAATKIEKGFIITKIGGKKVDSVEDIEAVLNTAKGGILIEGLYPSNPTELRYYGLGIS